MNHQSGGPTLGPHSKLDQVATFFSLSERAFQIYHDRVRNLDWSGLRPVHHLFLRKTYNAETTSFSTRLLVSWGFHLPALALSRVRLEQFIICSYLVHEEENIGLGPFVRHVSINDYLLTKSALEHRSIAENFSSKYSIAEMKEEAFKSQKELDPDFDIENDKLTRKWTRLDLHSLAKRRDALTARKSPISKGPIEQDYLSLYKASSSVVHSDCSSLSFRYLNIVKTSHSEAALVAEPTWAPLIAAFVSRYDVVQCFESLSFLGQGCEREFSALLRDWQAERDLRFGRTS